MNVYPIRVRQIGKSYLKKIYFKEIEDDRLKNANAKGRLDRTKPGASPYPKRG